MLMVWFYDDFDKDDNDMGCGSLVILIQKVIISCFFKWRF